MFHATHGCSGGNYLWKRNYEDTPPWNELFGFRVYNSLTNESSGFSNGSCQNEVCSFYVAPCLATTVRVVKIGFHDCVSFMVKYIINLFCCTDEMLILGILPYANKENNCHKFLSKVYLIKLFLISLLI